VIGDVPAPIDILLIEDDPGDVLLTGRRSPTTRCVTGLRCARTGRDALATCAGRAGTATPRYRISSC